jgi:nucleoside-diphosphate-sugar epimerase
MPRDQLFTQPDFIPPFCNFERFTGLRVGITGHRGVLGRILTERLREGDIKVDPYPGDITDGQALGVWFTNRSFDLFFHLAALVPVANVERNPSLAFEVNAIGTYRICERLVSANRTCWAFFASTSHIYEPVSPGASRPLKVGDKEAPTSIYGRTKLAAEHLCRQFLETYQHPYCIGRIFSYSHSSQQEPYLVPRLARQINDLPQGQRLTIINPDSVRDIVDAESVIDAILYLAVKRFCGTVNIGSGSGMSVADIARHVAIRLGKDVDIQGEPKGKADAFVADIEPLRGIIASYSKW